MGYIFGIVISSFCGCLFSLQRFSNEFFVDSMMTIITIFKFCMFPFYRCHARKFGIELQYLIKIIFFIARHLSQVSEHSASFVSNLVCFYGLPVCDVFLRHYQDDYSYNYHICCCWTCANSVCVCVVCDNFCN